MGKYFLLFLFGFTVFSSYKIYNTFKDGDIPNYPKNPNWGPKSKENEPEDISIRPFKIKIEEKVLSGLKTRLKTELDDNRIVAPLEGIGFEYGFNSDHLKTLGTYWLEKYDWRKREELLNKWPSFKTKISGIDIHFQHARSLNNKKYKNTRPLLLLHGWPGSFVEFQKSIPLLIDPIDSDVNFELIIPSLPGYGFSEKSHKPGMNTAAMAQIFLKLMKRIGHDKFYVQGGDWGSMITQNMATIYPENVLGLHMNMCTSFHPRSTFWMFLGFLIPNYLFTPMEKKYMDFTTYFKFSMREMGYAHIQASKPDTVGMGLSNSPLGLLAYITEKFSTWTNREWMTKKDGGLSFYSKDDLLDNIMVYWVTNSITTSQRLYYEFFSSEINDPLTTVSTNVPTGCLNAPNELMHMGKKAISEKFQNLVQISEVEKGGHFIAFEQPEIFSKDVLKFFNELEKMNLFKNTKK